MICNEAVIRNLTDAGCDSELIERYRALSREDGDPADITRRQARLLCEYRKRLLERIHEEQRRLDCLDYLLFHLREQHKEGCP